MNVRLELEMTTLEALAELRGAHLDSALEAQEALLEVKIRNARCYYLRARGEVAGYALLNEDALLEFVVRDPFLPVSHLLFRQLVAALRVRRAWIKTFDHLFLACALDIQVGVKVLGILVRQLVRRELPQLPGVRYTERAAEERDLPRLLAVDGNVFNHPERLAAAIRAGWVRVFEQDERLIGFGLLKPVVPGRPHVDVGLVVHEAFRSRGYAAYALRDLAAHCEAQGLIPISGCAADNFASINLGLRVGFVSRYRLLEVEFPPSVAAAV